MRQQLVLITFTGSISLLMCLVSVHSQPTPETKPVPTIVPKMLKLSVSGVFGPSYQIEWKEDVLIYTVGSGPLGPKLLPTTQQIKPPLADWKQFWKDTEAVHLWKWRSEYNNPQVADGTQWQFIIQQSGKQGKHIQTGGSNSYPSDKDAAVPSKQVLPSQLFLKYLAAIRRLIGNKDFK